MVWKCIESQFDRIMYKISFQQSDHPPSPPQSHQLLKETDRCWVEGEDRVVGSGPKESLTWVTWKKPSCSLPSFPKSMDKHLPTGKNNNLTFLSFCGRWHNSSSYERWHKHLQQHPQQSEPGNPIHWSQLGLSEPNVLRILIKIMRNYPWWSSLPGQNLNDCIKPTFAKLK